MTSREGKMVPSVTFKTRNDGDFVDVTSDDIGTYWDGYVSTSGIVRIEGRARFLDAKRIAVNGIEYSADHLVIATRSRPIVPPMPGAELGITSDGFFALAEQPKRVAIIGGGYIGVELAGVLQALGSQVRLVALENRVLERFDPMLCDALEVEMAKQGVDLHLGFNVAGLARTGEGSPWTLRMGGVWAATTA